MKLPLSTLEVFNAIAEEGSLRKAADRLGVRPSTVSHQLRALEQELGVSLFSRTTRSIALTEAGQLLRQGTHSSFENIAAAVQAVRDIGSTPRGTLRVTMPGFAYDLVFASKLRSFRDMNPHIELEISINEGFVDLFEEGFHAGVRFGDQIDQNMVAISIAPPLKLAVLASPSYIDEYGEPQTPQDLLEHQCIRYRFSKSGHFAPWQFMENGHPYSVAVTGGLIVNTLPTLYDAISEGHGLGFTMADYRPRGTEAVSLLTEYTGKTEGVFLYYPREYRSRQILRSFIDHIKSAS